VPLLVDIRDAIIIDVQVSSLPTLGPHVLMKRCPWFPRTGSEQDSPSLMGAPCSLWDGKIRIPGHGELVTMINFFTQQLSTESFRDPTR
jgi:hypothetical protein